VQSTMQSAELLVSEVLRHGATVHGAQEVIHDDGAGASARTFAELAAEAGRLASALAGLGVGHGDVVGTLC